MSIKLITQTLEEPAGDQKLVLVRLRRFRSAKKAQTITGQGVNISGFQRFGFSK
ncbi:conserved hypothetical protein [Microcystis sp. T1-4]|nr:conserved hypothetical protein [Microcystis sp. T1-4]